MQCFTKFAKYKDFLIESGRAMPYDFGPESTNPSAREWYRHRDIELEQLGSQHAQDSLVLEGPLAWAYHEGWSIDGNDVLNQIWAKWTETYHSEGPHGLFRVTIERLE